MSGLKHLSRAGALSAALGAAGAIGSEKIEKRIAGGRALSVRGLMARRMLMALTFRRMKRH